MDPAIAAVIAFLVEELREARKHAMPISAEVQLHTLLWQSARRTRKLERLAGSMKQLDAETAPAA